MPEQEPNNDLAELFARDPLELSDAEVSEIARQLRKQRQKFAMQEDKNKREGKKPRVKLDGITADSLNL